MTQYQPYSIECSCGNVVEIDLYQSVNVTVDESMISKVKRRKINNFKCDFCGASSELAYHFLYVDMKKKKWIWCYPESERNDKKKIEKEMSKVRGLANLIEEFGQSKPVIVFGYDELFAMID